MSVVDTNVLVVANGASDGAGPACQLAAVEALLTVRSSSALVLDGGGEILDEYKKHCSHSGQPGVGDEFFRWAVENAALLPSVRLVADPLRRFEEFPEDAALAAFDWDDRVFVATAVKSMPVASIVNAVDSDYSHHAEALSAQGVLVEELCPELLKPRPGR